MPKKICIVSYTDASRDPRVLRQVLYFRNHFKVALWGLKDPGLDGVEFSPIVRLPKKSLGEAARAASLLLGITGPASKRFLPLSLLPADQQYAMVLCDDAEPLPLAFELAQGAPVLFDAHEYYPLEFESSLKWRLFLKRYLTGLCRQYIPRCSAMTTVSNGLANRYLQEFGVHPQIVHSCPEECALSPSPMLPGRIRMVHHGAANKDRGLEQMIDTMRLLDGRFSLDFYLVGSQSYIEQLKDRAADLPSITWRTPLPMLELAKGLNGYDMGFYILAATGFNNLHALPNKFFEFIQARLGIAIGPSPDMADIVREHRIGAVASSYSPQDMAASLRTLTDEDIAAFKTQAHAAASVFTADNEMKKMHALVARLLGE